MSSIHRTARVRARRGKVGGLGEQALRRRRHRAWAVEALEGRSLLSVYLVNSPGDAGMGTGSVGDLRYAINQADQATGNSTIVFPPTLDGQTISLASGPLTIDKPSGTLTILGPGAGGLPSRAATWPGPEISPGSKVRSAG